MAELVVGSFDEEAKDLSNGNKQEESQGDISEETGEDNDGNVLNNEDGVNNKLATEGPFSLLSVIVLHIKAGQREDLAVKVDVAYPVEDILVNSSKPIIFRGIPVDKAHGTNVEKNKHKCRPKVSRSKGVGK